MWSCECVVGTTVSQQSRNMSPRNVCRSFAISLVIALLFLEIPINGLSIQRSSEKRQSESPDDLIEEESTLLEVKKNVTKFNNIKNFEVKIDKTLTNMDATEKDKVDVNTFVDNEKLKIAKVNIEEQNNNVSPFITTSSSNSNEQESTILFITTPTSKIEETDTTKMTTENEENKNITTKKQSAHFRETLIHDPENEFNKTTSYNTESVTLREKDFPTRISELPFQTSFINLKGAMHITKDETSKSNTQSPELQVTSTPLKLDTNKSTLGIDNNSADSQLDIKVNRHFTRFKEVPTETYTANSTNTPNKRIGMKTKVNFSLAPTQHTTKEINNKLESTLNASDIPSTASIDINNSDTTFSININTDTTIAEKQMPTDLDSSKSYEMSLKKYTLIDRKRLTTTENNTANTDFDTDMTRAETSQTNYIFDKSFSLTSLTSLEQIKADKRNNRNQLLHNQVTLNPIKRPMENEYTITASMSSGTIPQLKIGTVSSMRAGFLDYSGKTSISETTTNESNKDIFGNIYESLDLGENDRFHHKTISIAGAQSQLSEDAIKEELLKEEMMSDQIENVKKSRDDQDDNKNFKIFDTDARNATDKQPSQLTREKISDNELSVQPVSQEQGKSTDLYVVSPNYKPMKRIEVQPAKPFIRDPDDNSWRNVSISSLGIVFKPKNSSKSFTQVLKNKTETVLSSFTDRDNKIGLPDLRERLEKIAEVRKSKKKRVNKNGDTAYSDYEESNSSGENVTTIKVDDISSVNSTEIMTVTTTNTPTTLSFDIPETTQSSAVEEETTKVTKENTYKFEERETLTTQTPPNKFYNVAEYYDTTDEYDADYMTLSKIDIKKFTIPAMTTETTVASPTPNLAKPLRLPDKKPTVEYFPPRAIPKIYDYDNNFQKKINLYNLKENTKPTSGGFYPSPTIAMYEDREEFDKAVKPIEFPLNRHEHINLNKNLYLTEIPQMMTSHNGFDINEDNFNRAPYVIKHYRDFINAAAKGDDDKNNEYIARTETPVRGTALDELVKLRMNRVKPAIDHDYDYQIPYRKDTLNRFVNNYNNQNSEKYKVDFPIFFNNSIGRRNYQANGNVMTSSNVFVKRLYGNTGTATKPNFPFVKPCYPNCDKLTVELSPAYELHYYVPEQEEKQVAEITPRTVSYRYRL